MEKCQKAETKINWQKNLKLVGQLALGLDMCDVEEITDVRGEKLTDKEHIQLEETEVFAKTVTEALEEPQE
jgi:hypothetical protein